MLTVDRFGMADSAYAFDGIDDRINIGNPNLVNFTEDFSFTMWVNPSNVGNPSNSFPTFISKYSGVGFRETFFFGFNEFKTGLTAEITDETNEFTTVVVSVPDGEWHHVAMTYDLTAAIARIYLDGLPIHSAQPFAGGLLRNDPLQDILLGSVVRGVSSPHDFAGALDDVRIFNHTLSDQEVLDSMNPIPEPGTGLLVMTGLLGLGLYPKRRRRRA